MDATDHSSAKTSDWLLASVYLQWLVSTGDTSFHSEALSIVDAKQVHLKTCCQCTCHVNKLWDHPPVKQLIIDIQITQKLPSYGNLAVRFFCSDGLFSPNGSLAYNFKNFEGHHWTKYTIQLSRLELNLNNIFIWQEPSASGRISQ